MTRPGFILTVGLPGLVLLLVPAVWLFPAGLALHVTLVDDNTPVLVLPMEPGELFTLHYYHSVEHAPIWETHSMDKTGAIFIEEERYEKFGAGMGKMPGAGRMVKKGKYESIVDMHLPVGKFVLRVGSPGVDHTIIWRGRRFNLSENLSHKSVRFSGRPVKVFHKMRCFNGFWQIDPWPETQPQREIND
ncbi:MAG TPA: DUF1850 domain-containing protein [Desulfotignum sp.]|nr:DUF1850 domain-containing protein [Desulfotignum sp.]